MLFGKKVITLKNLCIQPVILRLSKFENVLISVAEGILCSSENRPCASTPIDFYAVALWDISEAALVGRSKAFI